MNDLTTALLDTLEDLHDAIDHGCDRATLDTLRIKAGSLVLQMQEQLDELDYEYALMCCEIGPDMAEHYKQAYLFSIRTRLEEAA